MLLDSNEFVATVAIDVTASRHCSPTAFRCLTNLMLLLQMCVQRRVVRIQQRLTQQVDGRTNVVAGGESACF